MIAEHSVSDLAVSPDGMVLAVPFGSYQPKGKRDGVHFIDATSGKNLRTVSLNRPGRVAFTPYRGILIAPSGATSSDISCSFIEPKTGTVVFKMPIPGGVCELSVSDDGKYLAAATAFGGAMVWNLLSIISAVKSSHS